MKTYTIRSGAAFLALSALLAARAVAADEPLPLPSPPSAAALHIVDADTPRGGHGQLVDGIPCGPTEMTKVHVHSHLTLIVGRQVVAVPIGVGIVHRNGNADDACIYWLHTHDNTGLLHVEAASGEYSLGQFFDIWGVPLGRNGFVSFHGPVIAVVDGRRWTGDPRAIPLKPHSRIVLSIGALVPAPPFDFPAGS